MLDARIWLPALGNPTDLAASTTVPFLVDTGADVTVLHPPDAQRLFHSPQQWQLLREQPSTVFGGAGQGRLFYQLDAHIILSHDDGTTVSHLTTLHVPEFHAGNLRLDSLLGRDILANYRVCFDASTSITLDPASAAR